MSEQHHQNYFSLSDLLKDPPPPCSDKIRRRFNPALWDNVTRENELLPPDGERAAAVTTRTKPCRRSQKVEVEEAKNANLWMTGRMRKNVM
ncbi:OLC1v1026395C1 [Oldenlandia corymbosa var. corymbosa]|uniref:OLC1v1026395C1 n=1 Tax=Oldenlandia corymbosa var. corymbosa TaxID=529605 RepID=A0AAV1C9P4_OLDCO|nr:OLC1v1026395C1 [Oldenlandia corymbosa var. corymbosa]